MLPFSPFPHLIKFFPPEGPATDWRPRLFMIIYFRGGSEFWLRLPSPTCAVPGEHVIDFQ
jgi:hypothetical protein